ncbi:MAG TPA: GDSL-type esterase/lipase family protein [Streptosporangiaceae bacterium]
MARGRLPGILAAVLATLIATAVVALGAAGPIGAARAESNGGVRVMPLGDSITDGLTVPGGYRIGLWQKFVAGGFTVDFVGSLSNGPAQLGDHDHEGHSGWRIDQIDANIVNWLRTSNPHTILLHIGTNDIIQNVNLSGAPARLGTLLDHITSTSPDAEVFVATIIPLAGADSAVRTFNAAIPDLVRTRANAGKHVHLVDMFPALTTADLADGVHPNAGGYAKMANVWFSALQSVPGSIGSTTPPTSPPPTSPPPTSPPPTGACTATYRLVNSWGTGLQGEVTVQNSRTQALAGWTVAMTLGGGQTIGNLWGGTPTATSGSIRVSNASYNGSVPGSGSTNFGFILNGTNLSAPAITGCTSP